MKKLFISAAAVAILAGSVGLVTPAQAQQRSSQQSSSQKQAPKIGLIDMGHVFKNYEKFKVLREDLKSEIGSVDQKAKSMAREIQNLQKQMKQLNEDSQEYIDRENKLAQMSSEFETLRKVNQRKFLRKESKIYKTIYMEVADAVEKYAQYYNYTLIIRFNRDSISEAEDPKQVIKGMNRNVVYYQPRNDITESVLNYLNKKYESSQGGSSSSQSGNRPAGATQRQR